ncbi:MAG: VWA domain-containing protein, partial [Deltaproteobacteria bacterium]
MRTCKRGWPYGLLLVACGCQSPSFVFQPDAQHGGVHLAFTVQTPSKADILFVIDNSGTMGNKQALLGEAFETMLGALAPMDTSYRIGVVSTDAYGFLQDCNRAYNPPVPSNTFSDTALGAKGNCGRPEVQLQRPHDGTLGRLLAAYDPNAFLPANFAALGPAAQAAIGRMVPTLDANTQQVVWPTLLAGISGPRHVIDRDIVALEACTACGCASCDAADANNSCAQRCAAPAAQAMV